MYSAMLRSVTNTPWGTCAAGMHDAFRNPFAVEMPQLLEQMVILK
ncbi:hypothetical protein HMSSN139_47170 [Paenibacillus sp. HMSSN-139]|nr:hypothetical protein HMSSN139_47170 [Paenibacillus sp. HMSSN-139]